MHCSEQNNSQGQSKTRHRPPGGEAHVSNKPSAINSVKMRALDRENQGQYKEWSVCVFVSVNACMCACMYARMYMNTYTYICIYKGTRIYTCVYVCIYIYHQGIYYISYIIIIYILYNIYTYYTHIYYNILYYI